MKKKEAKYINVEDALNLINTGDKIVLGMAASEPQLFVSRLHEVTNRGVTNVEVVNCLPINQDAPFFADPNYYSHFTLNSWFYSPGLRRNHKSGRMSFIPNHLHLAASKRLAHTKYNIFIGAAAMPDEHGYVSLSLSNVYEKASCEQADLVILEVNPNFPRTFGDLEIHISEIDYLIKTNYPAPEIGEIQLTEKDHIIGKFIADMIEDGSTIQLGIGGIPSAVAEALVDKRDLGIHTEMFTNGLMKLIEAGAVTGKMKNIDRGKHVACFAYGNRKLYDYINNNPAVLIKNGTWVNDPNVIGLNDKQISINSCLEISLDGQVASESFGTSQFSGTGGQTDTAVGAQNSLGGKSFIALYSTAMVRNKETGEREEVSKIVPILAPGAAVTLSRNDVDYVVTEYGIAALRGTSVSERTELLIAIAHPKFRDELRQEAIKYGFIGK